MNNDRVDLGNSMLERPGVLVALCPRKDGVALQCCALFLVYYVKIVGTDSKVVVIVRTLGSSSNLQ